MEQFTFTSKEKLFSFILIGLGVVAFAIGLLGAGDDFGAARLWTNVLHNVTFFLGIAFTTFLLLCAHTAAFSGWHIVFRRVMEAISSFIPVGGLLMLIIIVGTVLGWHDMYHWAAEGITDPNSENYDRIIAGKSAFLNKTVFAGFTIVMVVSWWYFFRRFRGLSIREDNEGAPGDTKIYRIMKRNAAVFLPIGGVTSAAAVWLWIMSTEPHWYSTLYAWYGLISWLVSGVAVLIMFLYYLKGKGYYDELLKTHIHDLGKYMFGFSIFWTYLWFSQFMLIWYANNGEETVHFLIQMQQFPVVFWGILFLNFVLPFLILMRNSTKFKQGSALFIAIVIFFGHWLDYFLMIKPGVYTELMHHHGDHGAGHGDAAHGAASTFMSGFHIPGLIEIGMMLGFAGLFVYIVFNTLSKAALIPKNDPFLEESLHHVGGPLGPEEPHPHH